MTFSQIFAAMVAYIQGVSTKITDFTSTSIIGQILSAIASVIDEIYFSITNAQNQAYISTASGTGLDNKGADYGVPRKQATAAQWFFTFVKNQVSTSNIDIPAGTIITTIPQPNQAPITFTTLTDTYLPVGSLNVNVLAECQTTGSIGNIASGTSLLIGSPTPGIDGVQLQSLTNGTYGLDIETDSAYQSRLLIALQSKAQSTKTWYLQTAESVVGVQSALVNPQGRGAGTVDIYIVGTNNTIPSSTLIASVQSVIDAGRVITDDAKVFAPTPVTVNETITIKVAAGVDPVATGNAVKTVITNYINNLGIGGGSSGVLYQSQFIAVALSVANVINATQTGQSDITFSTFQLPQAGTITINSSN